MQITTVHTLAFSIKCEGNDQQLAAMAIIKSGAASMGLGFEVNSAQLPQGESARIRHSSVKAWADDLDKCEHYWHEVSRALSLVGVDPTSP